MNSKKVNVGINGLGRIGRSILHNLIRSDDVNIVSLNELNNNIDNICYTLNYDSTYGLRETNYFKKNNKIFHKVTNKYINLYHFENVSKSPWINDKVDILIDSSGLKINNEILKNQKFKGIYKLQTHSDNKFAKHLIHGVNEENFNLKSDYNISSSICDSVAISPIIKVLQDFEILSGSITTVHPLLNYQNPLDSKSASWSNPGSIYGHFELGRGFINNIIPKPTSALSAVSKVLGYNLEKKISSFSYRIPTTIVGSADLTINLKEKFSKKDFLKKIKNINEKYPNEIVKVTSDRLTSLDCVKNENCCLLDTRWLSVKNYGNHSLFKAILWYDNEWGYSNKVSDLVKYIAHKIR